MEKGQRCRELHKTCNKLSLKESKGNLAQVNTVLVNRLIKITLDEKARGYTFVSTTQTAFFVFQSGVFDR